MTEYKMRRECGCVVSWQADMPEATWFRYCPTHEAAPDLLEACEALLARIAERYTDDDFEKDVPLARAVEDMRAKVRKAKGEGGDG